MVVDHKHKEVLVVITKSHKDKGQYLKADKETQDLVLLEVVVQVTTAAVVDQTKKLEAVVHHI